MTFRLIYEGSVDDSAETFRKIKAVMLSSLDLGVEEVRDILKNAPCTLKEAAEQEELIPAFEVLTAAGALVSVEASEHEVIDEWEDADEEFLIDIEVEEEEDFKPRKQRKSRQVYSIELDGEEPTQSTESAEPKDEASISKLLSELENRTQVEKPESASLEEIVRPHLSKETKLLHEKLLAEETAGVEEVTPAAEPETATLAAGQQIRYHSTKARLLDAQIIRERLRHLFPLLTKDLTTGKQRKKLRILYDSLLSILFSLLIVVGALWYLNRDIQEDRTSIKRAQRTLSKQVGSLRDPKKDQQQAKSVEPNTGQFKITHTLPERTLSGVFSIHTAKLKSLRITITTPPPAQLTNEDIIAGKSRQPWLERVLIDEVEITNKQQDKFLANGFAKLFIVQHKLKKRLAAKAVVSGTFNRKKQLVSAKVLINRGFKELPQKGNFIFERIQGQNYRLFFSAKIVARKVEEAGW